MAQPKKKPNLSNQQRIGRALNQASGCGYQETLRRVAEAARKGLPHAVVDRPDREQAVQILPAADASLLETPAAPGRCLIGSHRCSPPTWSHGTRTTRRSPSSSPTARSRSATISRRRGCTCASGASPRTTRTGNGTPRIGRTSLDRLEQQLQQHWRAMVGAVDCTDGFTTAEGVFQRDVWDLTTMTVLAGVPVKTLPDALRAWTRACSSVAAGNAGRALAPTTTSRPQATRTPTATPRRLPHLLPDRRGEP